MKCMPSQMNGVTTSRKTADSPHAGKQPWCALFRGLPVSVNSANSAEILSIVPWVSKLTNQVFSSEQSREVVVLLVIFFIGYRKARAFDDDFGVHSVLVVVMLVGVDLRAIDVIGVGKASVASTGGAIISIAWLIA